MRVVRLALCNDYAEWRAAARALLLAGAVPGEVNWLDPSSPGDLLDGVDTSVVAHVTDRRVGRVPVRFVRLAQVALCHADPSRFGLLYGLLWRLQKDGSLIHNRDDPAVARLERRVAAVAADAERMRTQLRFRRAVSADGHKGLAASFEPKHYVLERVAPHFTRTIAHEDWAITTPYRSAFWDGRALSFGDVPPVHRGA